MAIFREIEQRLENLVEGFFNHRFSSDLQPIELARKLATEMDRKCRVSVSRKYAPNVFMVHMSASDYKAVEGLYQALIGELTAYVKACAQEKSYRFTGPVHISIAPQDELQSGECKIFSHFEETSPSATDDGTQIISAEELRDALAPKERLYLLDRLTNTEYPLTNEPITVGRKSDNLIVVSDPGVSRYHARIEKNEDNVFVVDLNSTNGTLLNGKEISRAGLGDGDVVAVGPLELTFKHKTID